MKHLSMTKDVASTSNKTIVLLLLFLFSVGYATAQTISGIVTDSANEPLPGVSVTVKGEQKGTLTDFDGKYKLELSNKSVVLVFSYVGFDKQEVTVGNQTNISVVLQESDLMLDEVVVVGYGTMKKKDLTGAIGMVNAEALEKEQPNTLQDLLKAGVPGLSMGVATDAKGNSGDMIIRGKNSFSAKTDPLLVLDGVIYYGELTDINPNDVERIDVLKDASSAAVYGAKSANGVILITTKKGKSEKPVIRFGTVLGLAFRNSLPPTYKGEDYIRYRQAVMEAQNPDKPSVHYTDPSTLNNTDLDIWLGTSPSIGDMTSLREDWLARLGLSAIERRNYMSGNIVDWEDLTYQTAFNQDYSVSVSGKKDATSYYTSINYLKNESNVKGSGYSAVRARVNLESKAMKILTYGLNTQFTSRDEGYVPVGGGGYRTASPYGDVYDAQGKLTLFVNDNNNQKNPLLDSYYTQKEHGINNLNSSVYLKLDLPFDFSIQTTYAPRFQWDNMRQHKSTDHPQWNTEDSETAIRENKKEFYWQWDNMLKWNKEFGKSAFDFTFLLNWEKFQKWTDKMTAKGLVPSDVLGSHGVAWNTSSIITSDDSYSTGSALMARLHYSYADRYLITSTIRRDGYSAFGSSNPYATFPSVAVGWVFSEEHFFPKNPWFNYGKLRVSWGKNGNRDIGMYDALMRLEPRKYYYIDKVTGALVDINTYYSSRMENKDLKWESTSAYDVGLDFGLIDSHITGSIDVYQKRTNDLIVNRELPDVMGYGSVVTNIGQVQNSGIEISLNSRNISTKDFSWNTSFGFSYNKNKINKLYGLMENVLDENGNVVGKREADDITNQRFIGRSIDEIWDYKILGVWQEGEEMDAAAQKHKLQVGDFKIWDKDGSGDYSSDDKVFLGSKTPRYILNMRNSFTFLKNITFSFSMYAYLGHYQKFNRALNNGALINTTNQIKTEYWTPDNPTNNYARLGSKTPVVYSIWRKADILRLDNISIGYQFPKSIIQNWKIEALNANLTLKNIHYWSAFPGQDPESINSSNPEGRNVPRTVYFGLNVTF